jgi:hypothetical protein
VSATCPWCNAPRDTGPTCPRCGAIYAKAEAIKTQGRASVAGPAPAARVEAPAPVEPPLQNATGESSLEGMPLVEDPVLEWKLCMGALPIALCLALAFHVFMPFLQRTFLGMPVHELGHTITAWFVGHAAIPTLWKSLVSETRGFIAPIALLGAIGYGMYRAYLAGNHALVALGGALVLLQGIGTLVLKAKTADMLIVFAGDGAGMVLATALMASFFFGKRTQLYKGSLRWGFLVIGAAAFVDMFATWWAARSDFGVVPFGEQEGGTLSDATRLVDDFGWATEVMIRRYVALGVVCLVALALIYAWGVWQAGRAAETAARRPQPD